jgi:hypothetical protein
MASHDPNVVFHDPTSALAEAILRREPVETIQIALNQGASVASFDVISAIDEAVAALDENNAWLLALKGFPEIQSGLATRAAALGAAGQLKGALKSGNERQIGVLMRQMLDADLDASYDLGDGSVLRWAIDLHCHPSIIQLLMTEGEGSFWTCDDALYALVNMPDSDWKSAVAALPQVKGIVPTGSEL